MPDPVSSLGQALIRHPAFPVIPAFGVGMTGQALIAAGVIIIMILVIIRMKAPSGKRMELSQTIASLSESIRTEKGCRSCDFCQSIEDENRLFLLEEWDTQKNLMTHQRSDSFRVLQGAMNLLKEPYETMFHTIFHPVGIEKI